MNKRGFELTATYLVILILTITVFAGSIYFTRRFFSSAEEMRATIDAQTEAEINSLLYQEGAVVALPKFRKTIKRGQHTTFGLGVRNVLERTENFYITVTFKKAFNENEEVITTTDTQVINSKWLLYSQGPYKIENNKMEMIPILVNADLSISDSETIEDGLYSFNICVFTGGIPTGFDCENPPRLLPPQVYSGKVYKMYAQIV